jgi:DNA-binding MarR family transcriptional regulator
MHTDLTTEEYQALGEFRYQIRRFLHFSEEQAKSEGLEPQQHQMMLAIRACDDPEGPTMGKLAERLLIRHHSAVGLIDRLAERGLVARAKDAGDSRQVRLRLTSQGAATLSRLSEAHHEELSQSGPILVAVLGSLLQTRGNNDATRGQHRH